MNDALIINTEGLWILADDVGLLGAEYGVYLFNEPVVLILDDERDFSGRRVFRCADPFDSAGHEWAHAPAPCKSECLKVMGTQLVDAFRELEADMRRAAGAAMLDINRGCE